MGVLSHGIYYKISIAFAIRSVDRSLSSRLIPRETERLLPQLSDKDFPPSVALDDCNGGDVVMSRQWLWFCARSVGSRAGNYFP